MPKTKKIKEERFEKLGEIFQSEQKKARAKAERKIAESETVLESSASKIIEPEPEVVIQKNTENAIAEPIVVPKNIKNKIAESEAIQKSDGRRKLWEKITASVILVVVVGLAAATFYFYRQWKQTKADPQFTTKEDIASVTNQIGRFMELPADEVPTMATVTDVEKLKDQPFFARALNGDKALIYSKAGKAILYRPKTNKIVEVISLVGESGQLTSGQTAQTSPQTEQTQAQSETAITANVAIYNGTTTKGLAKIIGSKIETIEGITVSEKTNAKGTYDKTIVVDFSGNQEAFVKNIIEKIGGKAGSLPEGETKPEADILIIGGGDANIN